MAPPPVISLLSHKMDQVGSVAVRSWSHAKLMLWEPPCRELSRCPEAPGQKSSQWLNKGAQIPWFIESD